MMRTYASLFVECEIDRRRKEYRQQMFANKVLGEAKEDKSLIASVKRLISRVPMPNFKRKPA